MNGPSAPTLHVQWDGGGLAAAADQAPLLVGRATNAAVPIADRGVSREHLQLVVENGGWAAVDRSSRGTYDAHGQRVERVALGSHEVELHLGEPTGPTIRLATAAPVENHGTEMPSVPAIESGVVWTVATTDPSLRLELDGRERMFTPPGRVVVGRDAGCDVVTDNQLVSREHVAFTSTGKEWFIEDLGSSRGTYVDGKRLRKRQPARGAFVAMLGAEDAGEALRVVTAGAHKKPRGRGRLVAGVATVVVAALVAAGVALAVRDDDGGGETTVVAGDVANTREQLDLAAQSTMLVEALDEGGETMGFGSGSLVTPDGLILTNAHVVDPRSTGIETETDPAGYGIRVVSDPSEPAQPRYVAELVAVDPDIDVALIRIVADVDGQTPGPIDAPVLRIGESLDLPSGTQIHQLGFPGLARTSEVSIAEVSVQSFAPMPSCADAPSEGYRGSCVIGGPVADGLMNIAGAQFGGGSSGGPFVHRGELVAIAVGRLLREGEPAQGYSIPVHSFRSFLTENGVVVP